jgi:putative tricarboxylic transport membrane protein
MRDTQRSDLGAAIIVLATGLVSAWQAAVIPTTPLYAQVGPKAIPYVIAAGLVVLGIGLVAAALRGGWSHDLEEVRQAPPTNWRALSLLLAGLLANIALIVPFGFTVAATVQFTLVAAAFGSTAHARNVLIAFIVSLGAYALFVKALGVNIGAGVIEALVFGDPG